MIMDRLLPVAQQYSSCQPYFGQCYQMWSAPIKEKAANAVDLLFEPDYMEKVCVRMNRRGSFHKKIFTLTRGVIYTFRKLIV